MCESAGFPHFPYISAILYGHMYLQRKRERGERVLISFGFVYFFLLRSLGSVSSLHTLRDKNEVI